MALAKIYLGQRRLHDYAAFAAPEALVALRRMAEPLAGLRVLHLSGGPFGSAVAETLSGLVPLQRDLGLLADWLVLRGEAPRASAALYEGLGGADVRWGRRERESWHAYIVRHAGGIPREYDVVVAHDPQAIALIQLCPPSIGRPRWLWHCHLDTRQAQPDVWADLQRPLALFAGALFPAPDLVRTDLSAPLLGIAFPALDPCAPKNLPMASSEVQATVGRLGIDPARPLIGQFSPIDRRYAPMAALGAFWIARQQIPGLQMVLVDPSLTVTERSRRDLEEIAGAAAGDPDIHLLGADAGLGPNEINALQRGVAVALQLGVPRGFGWGIAECQWKERPVVVGRHGQLPDQVDNGAAGILVEGAADSAAAIVRLFQEPDYARAIGQRGRQHISRVHLLPGLAERYLEILQYVGAGARTLGGIK